MRLVITMMTLMTVLAFLGGTFVFAEKITTIKYDLVADFALVNQNASSGPWFYGFKNSTGDFQLDSIGSHGGMESYVGTDGSAIYKQVTIGGDCGIEYGKISMQCDGGTPVIRFVVPNNGNYNITINMGGSRSLGNDCYGNRKSGGALLSIDGTSEVGSFANDIKTFNVKNRYLNEGKVVVLSLPKDYGYGNTQTEFVVTTLEAPTNAPTNAPTKSPVQGSIVFEWGLMVCNTLNNLLTATTERVKKSVTNSLSCVRYDACEKGEDMSYVEIEKVKDVLIGKNFPHAFAGEFDLTYKVKDHSQGQCDTQELTFISGGMFYLYIYISLMSLKREAVCV